MMEKNYKEYVAIISQSSTDDPTVNAELVNEIGDDLVWTRSAEGIYQLTSGNPEAFPIGRTITSVQQGAFIAGGGAYQFGVLDSETIDESKLTLKQADLVDGSAFDVFGYLQVSVKVYDRIRR